MGLYNDQIATVNLMLTGLRNSVQRIETSAAESDPDALFIATFETLNWAVSLDDRIRTHWVPRGKPLGWKWRMEAPGGDLVAACRFVRNRVHHQWADALRLDTGGRRYPKVYPLQYREWVWRNSSDLPESDNPDRFPDWGKDEYVEHLQERPARAIAGLLQPCEYVVERLEPVHWLRPQPGE